MEAPELKMYGYPVPGVKKFQGKKKVPDRCIFFNDHRMEPVTVIFEVGVSQGGMDLQADAIHYLERQSDRGQVQLVVFINVEEDTAVQKEI
jgi:hypothetical protein